MNDYNLLESVENTIKRNKLIYMGDRILIGVSGGSDSMCLLDVLMCLQKKYSLSLFVVHVNHMLRGSESDDDEEFVRKYCIRYNIPFHSESFDVKKYSKDNNLSIEEAARNIRYRVFNKFLMENNIDKISVAHNKNDQVETTFMRIIRGTGLDGITSMDYQNKTIIRPLLDIRKIDIEQYCNKKGIKTIFDRTNSEDVYTRNKIRLKLIPYIENEINVDIIDRIHNMVLLLKEDKKIINDYIKSIYDDIYIKRDNDKIVLNLEKLKKLPDEIIKRVLRLSITELKGDVLGLEIRHINNLLKFVKTRKTGKSIDLPNGLNANISYGYFQLFLKKDLEISEFSKEIEIPGKFDLIESNLNIKFEILSIEEFEKLDVNSNQSNMTQFFDYDVLKAPIVIRNRRDGDYFIPYGFTGKKKLKDYFIDNKIPRDVRKKISLIANESEIIWIIGYKINNKYRITEKAKRVLKVTVEILSTDEE